MGFCGNVMDIAQAASDYQRDGCIRVRGFLEAAQLVEVRQRLDRYVREIAPMLPAGDRVFEADGVTVRNLWRMEQHDPCFTELAQRMAATNLVAKLVKGEPVLMGV